MAAVHPEATQHGGARRLAPALVVALVALAFGWPTRHGGFLNGDDIRFVVEHYLVNHPAPKNAAKLFSTLHDDLYQPLPMLSFQLDWARAAETPGERFPVSPAAFHQTNILLHVLCAVLALLLATRLAGCRRTGFLTGLMFACHPFALEAVAWINGRMVLLSTFFALIMMLASTLHKTPIGKPLTDPNDKPEGWRVIGFLSWVAAGLCKLIPTLPAAAAVCDYQVHRRLSRYIVGYYLALLVISVIAAALLFLRGQDAGFAGEASDEAVAPFLARSLLSFRYYVENYLWPARLSAWSPPPIGISSISPPVLIAAAELIALVAILFVTRRRNPAAFIGLAIFLILIAPFILAGAGRRQLAADRYMYLPILGLHLAVAATAVASLDRLARRWSELRADMAVGIPLVLLLAGWMAWGRLLAPTWRDSVSRDRRVAEVWPESVLVQAELAKSLNFEQRPDEALAVVAEARSRLKDHPRLAAAAGDAFRRKQEWDAAERELALALNRMPNHLLTRYRYGQTLARLGRADEAKTQFERIIEISPDYFPALVALARLHQDVWKKTATARPVELRKQLGNRFYGVLGIVPQEAMDAMELLERAVAVNPYHDAVMRELATLYLELNKPRAARVMIERILERNPADARARLLLAVVLVNLDDLDRALAVYDDLIASNQGGLIARVNRAYLLDHLKRTDEAKRQFRAILDGHPECREAAEGLKEIIDRSAAESGPAASKPAAHDAPTTNDAPASDGDTNTPPTSER